MSMGQYADIHALRDHWEAFELEQCCEITRSMQSSWIHDVCFSDNIFELKSVYPHNHRYGFQDWFKAGRMQNFPRALTNVFNTLSQFHSIRLKIYSYYFQVPGYKSIPPSNTVSLQLDHAAHPRTEYEVHCFIASCKKVEILDIIIMRNEGGLRFSHTSGQRSPLTLPVKLGPSRYPFGHSPFTV